MKETMKKVGLAVLAVAYIAAAVSHATYKKGSSPATPKGNQFTYEDYDSPVAEMRDGATISVTVFTCATLTCTSSSLTIPANTRRVTLRAKPPASVSLAHDSSMVYWSFTNNGLVIAGTGKAFDVYANEPIVFSPSTSARTLYLNADAALVITAAMDVQGITQ